MTKEILLTAEEMAACDRHTIEDMGVPSLVLMERAALATTDILLKNAPLDKVLVVCGTGNNGGDGLAVARMLFVKGKDVTVVVLGNPEKASEQTKVQLNVCRNYKIPILLDLPKVLDDYTTIVDAIFGIGLARAIEGRFAKVIQLLNQTTAMKLAVDMPSGISANTGEVLGEAFDADTTVTMAYRKIGQTLAPGTDYCGLTIPVDIGIYQA